MRERTRRTTTTTSRSARATATAALALCALVMVCASPSPAVARDMTGKGGFGTLIPTSDALGSTPTVALRYWRRNTAFEMHAGFDWLRGNDKVAPRDARRVHVGLGMIWALVDGPRLTAGLGLRGWLQVGSSETRNADDEIVESTNEVSVLVEALLTAEWFLSDHIGVSAAIGPSVLLNNSSSTTSGADPTLQELIGPSLQGSGSSIELGGRYSGGIGLTYYF
jgi:hypothetical protein